MTAEFRYYTTTIAGCFECKYRHLIIRKDYCTHPGVEDSKEGTHEFYNKKVEINMLEDVAWGVFPKFCPLPLVGE